MRISHEVVRRLKSWSESSEKPLDKFDGQYLKKLAVEVFGLECLSKSTAMRSRVGVERLRLDPIKLSFIRGIFVLYNYLDIVCICCSGSAVHCAYLIRVFLSLLQIYFLNTLAMTTIEQVDSTESLVSIAVMPDDERAHCCKSLISDNHIFIDNFAYNYQIRNTNRS